MLHWFRRMSFVAHVRRRRHNGVRTLATGSGAGLHFDPAGADASYVRGDSELPVQHALSAYLKPGMVFYDIGANVGFFSIIAAQQVGPTGHVYAFEPVPANAVAIKRNGQLNHFTHLTVFAQAVSDQSGQARLTLATHIGGATLESAGTPPDATETMLVEATTIDDALSFGRVAPPDIVKIDVEGAELLVLRGMTRTIANHRPIIIYEVDDAERHEMERKLAACGTFLSERGYRLQELADSYPGSGWHVAHIVATPAE